MKRIGILSDTHSCWDDRFVKHFSRCDEIWHAGDVGCIDTLVRLKTVCPVVRAVYGNIDTGEVRRLLKEFEIFQVEGFRVLLTHIGGYPGRYEPGIRRMIVENNVNLMVCGHSHILKVMRDPMLNVMHINPGAAGHFGWQKERTLIRVTIDGTEMRDLEVIELGKIKI